MVSQLDQQFDTGIIIPAYNEQSKISEIVKSLQKYFSNIFIVDDGSADNTYHAAKSTGAEVIRHPINLGQGAALQTGLTRALENPNLNYFLTFDADGQHSIESALEMLYLSKKTNVDLVMGSRFLRDTHSGMPQKKKFILKLAVLYTRFDTGLNVTDTHNGLRVMNRNFAKSLSIRKNGMAHASEILTHAKQTRASWLESPAQIYYTEYSIKKGQSIFNAINILTEMIHK